MDIWKFFAVGHARHQICNPTSSEKLDELVELLELAEGARMLDFACGKGELLVRAAKRWKARGTGVDLSPFAVADARALVAAAGLESSLEIVEAEGKAHPAEAEAYDLVACVGATWIWGGLSGTLAALAALTRPRGLVLVGEAFWRKPASPEYLSSAHLENENFGSHMSNMQTGLSLGLDFLHSIVSSEDDWDRYEGYQSLSAERYAADNPQDPDVPEILERIRRARDAYLNWGRDELGWALYLFQKP